MVNVVLGIVEKEKKILLVKRERGDFENLWAIPGGKIEECEHIDDAITREMREEIGISMKFVKLLGTATEIMHDNNSTSLLYICLLNIENGDLISTPEFETNWFSIDEIKNANNIIESDKVFIEQFYFHHDKNYLKLDCYRDDTGNYYWK